MKAKKNPKGLFVTIDGVDGTGKSTACDLVASAINALSLKSPMEPYATEAKRFSYELNAETRYKFYRKATQNDSKVIAELLKQGINVVCDRYIYSTYAYHVAMKPGIANNFDKKGLIEPDLAVLLTAPADIRKFRLEARKAKNPNYRINPLEEDQIYQENVQQIFRTMGLFEVDSGEPNPIDVANVILKKLRNDFGLRHI